MDSDENDIKSIWHYGIFELRTIGRALGVKSPSSLKKKDLINEIYLIINHKKEPCFSTRGRPSKYSLSKEIVIEKNEFNHNDPKEIVLDENITLCIPDNPFLENTIENLKELKKQCLKLLNYIDNFINSIPTKNSDHI